MKRILSIFAIVFAFLASEARADACTSSLGVFFTPAQARSLCTKLGSAYSVDFGFITGKTIAIQEATAASACSGTLTFNGTTPVVTSTTCATTGSRIFLTRTSAESTALNPFVSAITTGVSFAVTSEAGDTGTANWFIIHEAS